MSSKSKNLSQHKTTGISAASEYRIAIVISEYHEEITANLKKGCVQSLKKHGVLENNIFIHPVPGAYELPLAALWIYDKKKADAVICLGCVIKGATSHDVYINHAVSDGLMQLGLKTRAPFIFGLLTPNTLQQAKDRSGGKYGNKGVECAIAALKMLELKQSLKKK